MRSGFRWRIFFFQLRVLSIKNLKVAINSLQAPSAPAGAPIYQPPAIQNVAPSPGTCLPPCGRSCFTYCPQECCGVAGKRDKVIGIEGSTNEQTAEQDSENASGELEQNEEQKSDKQQNNQSQEGSSHDADKSEKAEKEAWR